VTITLTFAWWWLGVGTCIVGLILGLFGKTEGGYIPWPDSTLAIALILDVLGVMYLIFGFIARCFP